MAAKGTETAMLAGGCAWVMQQLLRHPDGVISTRIGFMGGEGENPTDENSGGHAEVVEVVFDPEQLSYRGLWTCSSSPTEPTSMKTSWVRSIDQRSSPPARSSTRSPGR